MESSWYNRSDSKYTKGHTNMNEQPSTQAPRDFYQLPLLCAVTLIGIEILPKPHDGGIFLFLLTVLYFAAVLVLLTQLDGPRERYLEQVYGLRHQEASEGVEHAWRQYLTALSAALYW